jgi:hypothetical protein
MQLVISPVGNIRCIYGEEMDLAIFGLPQIRRASHVEPTADGQWEADLSPVIGPILGPFASRSDALAAEVAWLQQHWHGE